MKIVRGLLIIVLGIIALVGGRTYVAYEGSHDRHVPPTPPATSTPVTPAKSCVVGGCSAQLCTDASQGPAISTCEYRAEYGCYQSAKCEVQPTGDCGWTPTPELSACIAANTTQNPNGGIQ